MKNILIDEIPKTHIDIITFIDENKDDIIKNPFLISAIIKRLDELLKKCENTTDFSKDISIMYKTIQFEYESILKEYNLSLNIDKLIYKLNNDDFDLFFEYIKKNEKSFNFIDFLYLDFDAKERKQAEKIKYDQMSEKEKTINFSKNIEENYESLKEIKIIKDIVNKNKEVDYYNLIIDPCSYSKTIYNSFNLALAVRLKYVSFKIESKNIKVVPYEKTDNKKEHYVFSISKSEFENIIKLKNIKKKLL